MLDFGYISSSNLIHYYNSFNAIYNSIGSVASLRKVIVAAGSFPVDLSHIPKHTKKELPRVEWQFWQHVKEMAGASARLVFADYSNVHPVYDADSEKRRGTCSIKYTGEKSFLVLKGESMRRKQSLIVEP